MLKKCILFTSFISLLCIANVTTATITATTCNGCGPAALRQEALDEGNGDHYIYDFVYRKLTHYSIAGQGMLTTPKTSTYITIVPNNVLIPHITHPRLRAGKSTVGSARQRR